MRLSRDAGRSAGAIAGLAVGVVAMWSLGYGGLIPLFCFGAGGAVAGGMTGEWIFRGSRLDG